MEDEGRAGKPPVPEAEPRGGRQSRAGAANLFARLRTSLRARILIISAILATIPLGVVGIVSYSLARSAIRDNALNNAVQLAGQINRSVSLVFKDTEKLLRIGKSESAIGFVNPYLRSEETLYNSAMDLIGLFKLFRGVYESDRYIEGIYVLGLDGACLSERDGRYVPGADLRKIPTVASILSTPGKIHYIPNRVIDYAPDPGYRNVISVGTAIVRPSTKEVFGVIIVDLDGAAVEEISGNASIGETGSFAIIDAGGQPVFPWNAAPEPAASFRAVPGLADSGHLFLGTGVNEELIVYNTLENSGWKIAGRARVSELMRGAYYIRAVTFALVGACVLCVIILYFFISGALTHPLRDLKEKMKQAESGDLEVRAFSPNRDEVAELCHSFNVMIAKLKELMEKTAREQDELKKAELKALQAQINPHFLYNTLDAIIWMTESNNRADVVRITKTLSTFFRLVLSKGEEWIRVADEMEHVRSYLDIQQFRYRDILEYSIELDGDLASKRILKLTLQPIVENAIYHGIKNRRGGGCVRVTGQNRHDGSMVFEVSDDGPGMDPEKLGRIREAMESEFAAEGLPPDHPGGYGLRNVNQRVKLYYGRQWGVGIESVSGSGTRVTLRLPVMEQQ